MPDGEKSVVWACCITNVVVIIILDLVLPRNILAIIYHTPPPHLNIKWLLPKLARLISIDIP